MLRFIQILIYLFCVYLIFKGVLIFQVAFVSESVYRKRGVIVGVVMTALALVVAVAAFAVTELYAYSMLEGIDNLKLN